MSREVVITGIGVILPNCDNKSTLWDHLRTGQSQLSMIEDPVGGKEKIPAGHIQGFQARKYLKSVHQKYLTSYSRALQFYLTSLLLARDDAQLDFNMYAPDRIGLFDGSSRGTFSFWQKRVLQGETTPRGETFSNNDIINGLNGQTVGVAAALFNICGPTVALSGSCVSGALSTGYAYKEIKHGEIDAAIATGHESVLLPELYTRYREAGLLSQETQNSHRALKPFGKDANLVFGEGAISLILEERKHAERRGAHIIARISGFKHGNEGYNPLTVDISGKKPAKLIRSLLDSTNASVDQIDFVVGHGNGVPQTGMAEVNYMKNVFGDQYLQVPLISTKPIYGHLLGGSSSLNIAATALMLKHQYIIPTINTEHVVGQEFSANFCNNSGAKKTCQKGLSFSYGMGGFHSALLLDRG